MLLVLLRSDVAVSGRALARMSGLPQSTAQRALVRLRDRGLVLAPEAPPSLLYRANRDHLPMPAIVELLTLRERLHERAIGEVDSWTVAPTAAVLYGSVARGDAHQKSDVDVLLVRPPRLRPDEPIWEAQVVRFGELLTQWTGRPASVIELTSTQARQGLAAREPYLVAAAAEGLLLRGRDCPSSADEPGEQRRHRRAGGGPRSPTQCS